MHELYTTHIELPTGQLTVEGDVEKMMSLCGFGARQNPKRGFLIVSKVLGKHYPSSVESMDKVHRDLAMQLQDAVIGSSCFVGLAETAVGLAHGVYERYLSMTPNRACFIHSTRYRLSGYENMYFEESHSHAPNQLLHLPEQGTVSRNTFDSADTLVLLDDEISTGKTLTNLSLSYLDHNPQVKRIVWVSLTDFSNNSVEQINGVPVISLCLFKGSYSFEPDPTLRTMKLPEGVAGNDTLKDDVCHLGFGRVGISDDLNLDLSNLQDWLKTVNEDDVVLVVGSGECMHPAFLLAREIQRHNRLNGVEVFTQSTTRSPAMVYGAIGCKLEGKDTYGEGITNYLYNVKPGTYDKVLFVTENANSESAKEWAALLHASLCSFDNRTVKITEEVQ